MNIFDDPTTHRAQRVEFSEGEYTAEERSLVKKLASLQESYAMEAKPFIDRLVSIRAMRPTPQMMVTLEQAFYPPAYVMCLEEARARRMVAAGIDAVQTAWEDTRTQRDELMAHIKDGAPLPEWAVKWIAACRV